MDRLNHASEILAALAVSINQTNLAAKGALSQLCFEANQEILAVLRKPADNMRRWMERNHPAKGTEGDGGASAETV
jgi:hypothetical protein